MHQSSPHESPTQGTMAAMFCKHEGFLGAIGAFLQVHPIDATVTPPTTTSTTTTTTPAVTHVSPPHTPSPEPTAPFDGAPTLQGGSTWPAVEEHQVGDNTPAQDPVAALECGWSQAAQGIDDFAGAIGGVWWWSMVEGWKPSPMQCVSMRGVSITPPFLLSRNRCWKRS